MIRYILYAVIVLCFAIAGILDIAEGETKLGVVGIGFGVMNFLIFFWRGE